MSQQKEKTPNELLQDYLKLYLAGNNDQDELEIRFGTKYYNTISKIDFDNIVEKIKSFGFTADEYTSNGEYTLNIQNEYANPKTGRIKMSNIRTSITGLTNIQKYCKENVLREELLEAGRGENYSGYGFLQKFPKNNGDNILNPIDFHDFHFRVNFKTERKLNKDKYEIINLIEKWKHNRKIFRFIKRYTFKHPDYPFRIDCSIVKTSKKRRTYIPEYSIQESNVFNNPENYEIEIELDNKKYLEDMGTRLRMI